jgi:hypothetical protein
VVAIEDCFAHNVSATFDVARGDELFFDYSVFSP